MSAGARQFIGLTIALLLATLAQAVYADILQIRGARPDFLVAVALLGSLFCNANGGAALGFFAGLFHAALASPPAGGFGSLIVSRTLVCIGVGWLEERLFRDNPLTAFAIVTFGTALAETLFFIFAPQPNILHWARNLGLTTLYNAVLALPLYWLVRRLVGAHRKERKF
jgi:hypothetical protein